MIWFPDVQSTVQIGVGLMLLQQCGGSTALAYYASSIFVEAGKFNGL